MLQRTLQIGAMTVAVLAAEGLAQQSSPKLVTDIHRFSTPDGSRPGLGVRVGNSVFFSAYEPVHGRELWKSDGTPEGTVLVRDINSGRASSSPSTMRAFKSRLYFSAYAPGVGNELWVSDGTQRRTKLVADLNPGTFHSNPNFWAELGGRLFFTAAGEWYTLDGTTGAPKKLSWQPPFSSPYVSTDSNTAIFVKDGGVWRTDGTPAGTARLVPPSGVTTVVRHGKLALFVRNGRELWKTDGTLAGTSLVKHFQWYWPLEIQASAQLGKHFFFQASTLFEHEIWKTDGTPSGTTLTYKGVRLGREFATLDRRLYFSAQDHSGYELWSTDGTTQGTQRVADIARGSSSSSPQRLHAHAGKLFFTAVGDARFGRELFVSNGTEAGTRLVRDLATGNASANPRKFLSLPTTLLFVADGTHTGAEVFTSDGTTNGTRVVKDIHPGEPAGALIARLADHHGTLFFAANDGIHGSELWRSDGTAAGTRLVKDIEPLEGSSPTDITSFAGAVFFVARDPSLGVELWKTDGTTQRTQLLKDLMPGQQSSYPVNLTVLGNKLYFIATTPEHGREIYVTDGTAKGTRIAADIVPGSVWSDPRHLTAHDGSLYFTAFLHAKTGRELWVSDGTASGTQLVKDIVPGPASSSPIDLVPFGGKIYFRVQWKSQHLWSTDGTASGTQELAIPLEIRRVLAATENALYLRARSKDGDELWRTDGTAAGTKLVQDIWPGPSASAPDALLSVGNRLLFSASVSRETRATFVTEGSAQSTKRIGTGATTAALMRGALYLNTLTKVGNELCVWRPGYASAVVRGEPCGPTLPQLAATTPVLGQSTWITGSGYSTNPGYLFMNLPRAHAVVANCFDFVGILDAAPIAAVGGKSYSYRIHIPNSTSLIGLTVNLQSWFFTPQTFFPLQTSNGVQLTLGR